MASKTKVLRNDNNHLDEQLSTENNEIVTNMIVYIRSFYLSDYKQEVIRHDITQMVIDGQNRGEKIEDIIGEDYKEFCDNIIKEMPKRTRKEAILSGISLICLIKAILTTIWFCTSLTEALGANKTWPFIPLYIGTLISALIIVGVAVFIVYYICRNAFIDRKSKSIPKVILFLIIFAFVSGILSKFIFRATPITSIHFSLIMMFIIGFIAIHKGIDYYLESKEATYY